MQQIQQLCDALEKKKQLFATYAACTEQLLQCDAQSMEYYSTNRMTLANEIDEIDVQIKAAYSEAPGMEQLCAALDNSCDYAALAEEARPVFLLAQEIRGSMQQARTLEPAIRARMETLMEEARTQIAAMQHTPKIARYLNGMQTQDTELGLLGARYDKV